MPHRSHLSPQQTGALVVAVARAAAPRRRGAHPRGGGPGARPGGGAAGAGSGWRWLRRCCRRRGRRRCCCRGGGGGGGRRRQADVRAGDGAALRARGVPRGAAAAPVGARGAVFFFGGERAEEGIRRLWRCSVETFVCTRHSKNCCKHTIQTQWPPHRTHNNTQHNAERQVCRRARHAARRHARPRRRAAALQRLRGQPRARLLGARRRRVQVRLWGARAVSSYAFSLSVRALSRCFHIVCECPNAS